MKRTLDSVMSFLNYFRLVNEGVGETILFLNYKLVRKPPSTRGTIHDTVPTQDWAVK